MNRLGTVAAIITIFAFFTGVHSLGEFTNEEAKDEGSRKEEPMEPLRPKVEPHVEVAPPKKAPPKTPLVRKAPPRKPPAKKKPIAALPKTPEEILWEEVAQCSNFDDVNAYLSAYPAGRFLGDARECKEMLIARAWKEVSGSGNEYAYLDFMKKYPGSVYEPLALSRYFDPPENPKDGLDPMARHAMNRLADGWIRDEAKSNPALAQWLKTNKRNLAQLEAFLAAWPNTKMAETAKTLVDAMKRQKHRN